MIIFKEVFTWQWKLLSGIPIAPERCRNALEKRAITAHVEWGKLAGKSCVNFDSSGVMFGTPPSCQKGWRPFPLQNTLLSEMKPEAEVQHLQLAEMATHPGNGTYHLLLSPRQLEFPLGKAFWNLLWETKKNLNIVIPGRVVLPPHTHTAQWRMKREMAFIVFHRTIPTVWQDAILIFRPNSYEFWVKWCSFLLVLKHVHCSRHAFRTGNLKRIFKGWELSRGGGNHPLLPFASSYLQVYSFLLHLWNTDKKIYSSKTQPLIPHLCFWHHCRLPSNQMWCNTERLLVPLGKDGIQTREDLVSINKWGPKQSNVEGMSGVDTHLWAV